MLEKNVVGVAQSSSICRMPEWLKASSPATANVLGQKEEK
jgi:hypothetical protein